MPFGALIAFADPQVSFGLHFRVVEVLAETVPTLRPRVGPVAVRSVETAAPGIVSDGSKPGRPAADTAAEDDDDQSAESPERPSEKPGEKPSEQPQVVSLDAFRRRPTPKE